MMKTNRMYIPIAVSLFMLAGCSSAPKRPAELFVNRNAAIGQLDLGNQAVSKGDYANAHLFIQEAWRLAVSTDDPATRIQVRIAEGNAWFNEGQRDKAAKTWEQALREAELSQNKTLTSLSRLYLARGALPEGRAEGSLASAERQNKAGEVKAVALKEMSNVQGTPLYLAFAWKVIGLADKELGNWAEAEKAILKAADLHEKGRYLEEAAYDWYLIASVRSKAGQYEQATAALQSAIGYDRRAENANGLGMDWLALGEIEEKAGHKDKAAEAYRRSSDIFTSAYLADNAAGAEKKLAALSIN
jgi:tetratricopeptide (TPR) repeat protein